MRHLLTILISLLCFSQVTAQQADTLIFQGGDQIGMPKANGGGLSEPYTSDQELTGQNASPSANGYTIGGIDIPKDKLPALIKDNTGAVYSVDATGNVTQVGAYGGPTDMQKQTPNTALGITVSFAPVAGMKYGFDPFQPRYAEKPAMEPHYLKLGDQYYSAKAITPGDVDQIGFSVSPRGTKLRFVNRNGFEYKQNGGVLTLAGGPAEDAQEIMAVYTKGGTDYVVGALLLASYPVKHQNVVIVLTDAAQTITDSQRAQLEASLNASFGQAGMYYTVTVDATSVAGQGWCGSPRCSAFRPEGSGLLDNDYTGDEAKMIEFFTTRTGFTADPTTAYLFAVSTSLSGATEGGLQGKMNFDKQFGFLYNVQTRNDLTHTASNFTTIGRTLAHEVGHGSFKLYHIFENMYLGPDAKEDINLMSYSSLATSNLLNKLQWDIVHKPGVTWGVFARDKDQMAQISGLLGEIDNPVGYEVFMSPSGYPVYIDSPKSLWVLKEKSNDIAPNKVFLYCNSNPIYAFKDKNDVFWQSSADNNGQFISYINFKGDPYDSKQLNSKPFFTNDDQFKYPPHWSVMYWNIETQQLVPFSYCEKVELDKNGHYYAAGPLLFEDNVLERGCTICVSENTDNFNSIKLSYDAELAIIGNLAKYGYNSNDVIEYHKSQGETDIILWRFNESTRTYTTFRLQKQANVGGTGLNCPGIWVPCTVESPLLKDQLLQVISVVEVLGVVPILGDGIDLALAPVYYVLGENNSAAICLASVAIPFSLNSGNFSKLVKVIRKSGAWVKYEVPASTISVINTLAKSKAVTSELKGQTIDELTKLAEAIGTSGTNTTLYKIPENIILARSLEDVAAVTQSKNLLARVNKLESAEAVKFISDVDHSPSLLANLSTLDKTDVDAWQAIQKGMLAGEEAVARDFDQIGYVNKYLQSSNKSVDELATEIAGAGGYWNRATAFTNRAIFPYIEGLRQL